MISATRLFTFLILLISLSANAAPEAERLGTLFYTPAERATIAAGREGNNSSETATGITLGGIIKRESGKGTVWVNRNPIPEGQSVPPASAPKITTQGVTINGKPVRVGETVDLVTGDKIDLLPPGSVSVGKKK